jgi:hypothetical protein
MFKKLAIGLGSFIVIAAIVICAIPLKTVSYTVSVPYQDVEEYQVEEPLSYVIAHYEDDYDLGMIVTIDGDYYYQGEKIEKDQYRSYKKYVYSWLEISNADDVAGDFTVTWRCSCPGTQNYPGSPNYSGSQNYSSYDVSTKYVYVRPAQTELIWYSGNIPLDCTVYWSASPPTKTVTKYRIVEKQRQETRYKSVTILEYLTSY